MKYGLIPTSMIERVGLAFGKVPIPLLDALFGPLKARAIMAGVSLGVFEALHGGPRTSADLAARLGLDPDALDLLLRTLVVCGYLVPRHAGFALSSLARRTMLARAPMPLVGYLRFNYMQWEFIEHLETLVRTGRGRDFHDVMTEPDHWRMYQLAMQELARIEVPVVASRVPVPRKVRSLLDVAGGHGLFGAAICRRHPPMRCTVLETARAVPHARALAAEADILDVVSYRVGDVLTSDFGRHDVILLFNILHHVATADIGSIVSRAHGALRPGGTIAIWEPESSRRDAAPTSGDAAALFFRLTSTAGAYHGDDYARWLGDAGFRRVTVTRPLAVPGKVLITGRR